jgi:hypothetical protein
MRKDDRPALLFQPKNFVLDRHSSLHLHTSVIVWVQSAYELCGWCIATAFWFFKGYFLTTSCIPDRDVYETCSRTYLSAHETYPN